MKLKKEFSDFYSYIRIDSETNALIDKKNVLENDIKNNLPSILEDCEIHISKTDIRMIDQGSYKYNTTISADVVDRDVAVMIPLDTTTNADPRKLKGYLQDAVNITSRTVTIKEPCVRVSYYENGIEYLHIDLPLYAEDGLNIYLARGRMNSDDYSWEIADPDGINNDLCNRINKHDQLRRTICYVKKWRNEKYSSAKSDHEIPPSIGLTYLVCDCFTEQITPEGDDDLLALQKTMKAIKDKFSCTYNNGEVISADVSRYLTFKPYTDVFNKMRNSSQMYMLTFYKRLSKAVDNLTNAVNVESEHDAAEYVQRVLGSAFVVPPKATTTATVQSVREHSFGQ